MFRFFYFLFSIIHNLKKKQNILKLIFCNSKIYYLDRNYKKLPNFNILTFLYSSYTTLPYIDVQMELRMSGIMYIVRLNVKTLTQWLPNVFLSRHINEKQQFVLCTAKVLVMTQL